MKILRYLVLAILAAPALADPTAQQQYETLQQAYYHFDPKTYLSFTCHVEVSNLDAMVAYVKQISAARPGVIQVNDQLGGYSLTVDHKDAAITDPSLDIVVVNEKGAVDSEKLKLGVEQMKHGFGTGVQGADQMITSIFQAYLDTHQDDITSVTRDGNKWIVKSIKDGATDVETIDGGHAHDEIDSNGVSVVSESDYAPLSDGKLGLQTANIKITQGPQNMTSDMTVTYQKLGVLQVPASLVTKTMSSMAGVTQTADITINFQNCSIKN